LLLGPHGPAPAAHPGRATAAAPVQQHAGPAVGIAGPGAGWPRRSARAARPAAYAAPRPHAAVGCLVGVHPDAVAVAPAGGLPVGARDRLGPLRRASHVLRERHAVLVAGHRRGPATQPAE